MSPTHLMATLPELARRINQAEQFVVGLDFDGTLTPIRSRPEDVVLAAPVRAVLERLTSPPRVQPVVVSGRSLADVAERVGLPDLIYAGNHGLEIRGPGLDFVEPSAAAMKRPLDEVTEQLRHQLSGVPGVLVEPKGLTTSVHYRNVPPAHREELADTVRKTVEAAKTQFALASGHAVWEIRPRVAWHKGHAMRWVIEHLRPATNRLTFFIGDDQTDEDAFSSLPESVTVKVGALGSPTRAHYWLPDHDAVHEFLEWLAERLTPQS
jgi:trehalose 6-phosphate phosphatase